MQFKTENKIYRKYDLNDAISAELSASTAREQLRLKLSAPYTGVDSVSAAVDMANKATPVHINKLHLSESRKDHIWQH